MKNKTFMKISALIVAILMSLSLFSVYASATEKVIYEEDNCDLSYEDGVITVTMDAGQLGDVIESGKFSLKTLEKLLPSGVYRIIDERSKKSVIDFLITLAEKDVLTYDEILKAFSGNEEVMLRYINFDFVAPYVTTDKEITKDAMKRLYEDGKLDAVLAAPGFKDALTEKAGTKDIPEAVTHYAEFVELVQDMEVGDLFPMRDLWEYVDIPGILAKASGSAVNKSLRTFVNQVITGEIDEAYINETQVFFSTERGKELDHNILQTAILQGFPSIAELETISAGDTLLEYDIDTIGLPNKSGEARVDMHFTFKLVLKGNTSKINRYASKLAAFMEYVVADDGLITVNMDFTDGVFAENYAQVLDNEEISKERKLEYLGLYTADAEELKAQLSGEKFEEFLSDAISSAVWGSEKAESRRNLILKFRNLLLRAANYETVFTTIDDTYQGNGYFKIRTTEVIPMSVIKDKAASRFSSVEELFKWLSSDDHIVDTEFNIEIANFYRVRYFDENGELLYLTYIPVGTDLSFFDDVEALQDKAPYGWVDVFGDTYTEMPDEDLDLYAAVPTQDVEVVKIWDDNDNEAGMRPESITISMKLNGTVVGVFDLTADTIAINEEFLDELLAQLEETVGDTVEVTEEMKRELLQTIPLPENDEEEDDENVWSITFSGVPMFIDGEPVEIEIEEAPVDNYESDVVKTDTGFEITNTYVEEYKDVVVTKIWNDDNNNDGARPASITVTLFADGEEYDKVVIYGLPVEVTVGDDTIEDNAVLAEVSEDGNTWTYTFEEVPTYANGAEITYTVEEDAVDGYGTTIDGFTITNTRASELVTVAGTKVWDDENNRRNKRPGSVTIILLANGEEVARKEIDGEGNEWAFEFNRLPKYADGEEITYTVDEVEVEKYAKTVDGLTITNTYVKSPDTGAAEISLFVILGVLAAAGAAVTVTVLKRRKEQD